MFLRRNFQTVLYSLQHLIDVNKTTCLSSRKCHRGSLESTGFWYIFSESWIYGGFFPGFPLFYGYQADASPKFPLLHLHAPELHHFFMNNTFIGSKPINMGMHFAYNKCVVHIFPVEQNLAVNPVH